MRKRVLVAFEESGRVRDAFLALGHDAVSCDLVPSRAPGPHIVGDARGVMRQRWDLVVAFPPCTDLCVSGSRHFELKRLDGRQAASVDLFLSCIDANAPQVVVENPVGIMSTLFREPDQIVQPWMFGHGETKATCLWLKGLPRLRPTHIVEGREAVVHRMAPGPNRARDRSATYPGIASAMAMQFGSALVLPTLFGLQGPDLFAVA